jgi:hypothetical protein
MREMDPRVAQPHRQPAIYPDIPARQAFHRPRGLPGVAGHWIHLGAVLSPLIIGEMIPDPDKRWRAIRLSTAVAAVASEALWTHRLLKKRAQDEEREHEFQR